MTKQKSISLPKKTRTAIGIDRCHDFVVNLQMADAMGTVQNASSLLRGCTLLTGTQSGKL